VFISSLGISVRLADDHLKNGKNFPKKLWLNFTTLIKRQKVRKKHTV